MNIRHRISRLLFTLAMLIDSATLDEFEEDLLDLIAGPLRP